MKFPSITNILPNKRKNFLAYREIFFLAERKFSCTEIDFFLDFLLLFLCGEIGNLIEFFYTLILDLPPKSGAKATLIQAQITGK